MTNDKASNQKESRTPEDIRQHIADSEENISQTVGEISERIKEKLDWREHVNNAPYLALGAAAGLGFIAAGMFVKRRSPIEQVMDTIDNKVRRSLGGMVSGAIRPSLIKMALFSIISETVSSLAKNAVPTNIGGGGGGGGGGVSMQQEEESPIITPGQDF